MRLKRIQADLAELVAKRGNPQDGTAERLGVVFRYTVEED